MTRGSRQQQWCGWRSALFAVTVGLYCVGNVNAGGTVLYKTVDKNGNVVFTDRPPAADTKALVVDESKKTGAVVHGDVPTRLYCGDLQVSFELQPGESSAEALTRLRKQKALLTIEQDKAAVLLRMHSKKQALNPQDGEASAGAQLAAKERNEYSCAINYLNRREAELKLAVGE